MRKFNSKKHKGAKSGYKSFTHVEIIYENCEHWLIPVRDIIDTVPNTHCFSYGSSQKYH